MRARVSMLLLTVLAAAGCGSAHAPSEPPPRFVHGDGLSYSIPPGWHVAHGSLTPHLVNPRQVLTVGTGPLPSGGACAQFPSAALGAMRDTDVLLAVQERLGATRSFPLRPSRFGLPASGSEAEECVYGQAAFVSHWFEFRDGGRGFHVLVAVGRAAPRWKVRQALGVLDSLRITPRRPARVDPDSAIPYDSRGVHLVLPGGWRVYKQALTQAVSKRDQIAIGTFPLEQRTPDANCTPATALRTRPPDGGFVFMMEVHGVHLQDFPPRPARFRLPAAVALECFGRGSMVVFRDHGRAFQALFYGPASRRRQALEILDSLRVDPAP
jgi:hypothetical protein